jgi:hypothetical protein
VVLYEFTLASNVKYKFLVQVFLNVSFDQVTNST